jgi:WW domain/PH domain
MQRIPRYKMLLESVCKELNIPCVDRVYGAHDTELNHEQQIVIQATSLVMGTAIMVNETRRYVDNLAALSDLDRDLIRPQQNQQQNTALSTIAVPAKLADDDRRLLLSDRLLERQQGGLIRRTQKRRLFLCNDVLVVSDNHYNVMYCLALHHRASNGGADSNTVEYTCALEVHPLGDNEAAPEGFVLRQRSTHGGNGDDNDGADDATQSQSLEFVPDTRPGKTIYSVSKWIENLEAACSASSPAMLALPSPSGAHSTTRPHQLALLRVDSERKLRAYRRENTKDTAADDSGSDQPLPAGWVRHWDRSRNREFFYNEFTKESAWHAPHVEFRTMSGDEFMQEPAPNPSSPAPNPRRLSTFLRRALETEPHVQELMQSNKIKQAPDLKQKMEWMKSRAYARSKPEMKQHIRDRSLFLEDFLPSQSSHPSTPAKQFVIHEASASRDSPHMPSPAPMLPSTPGVADANVTGVGRPQRTSALLSTTSHHQSIAPIAEVEPEPKSSTPPHRSPPPLTTEEREAASRRQASALAVMRDVSQALTEFESREREEGQKLNSMIDALLAKFDD